ncbi:MAG: STAS domain-containing protein [Alphaproteobacteria bacterium]|nr:STAS domain-containing protein [Alphaproteobacteria bacterium]
MAFQFKRDRGDNITLILAGDIDLEVTPEIKTQLSSQLEDAASLTIDASNISYLDSSGVSILVIAMQNSKQKQIVFSISNMSDEAMRVLQLAKLDKILPIKATSGPAQLVDIDVFSKTGEADSALASQVAKPAEPEDSPATTSNDDDLIAALASGDMAGGDVAGGDMTVDATDDGQTVDDTPPNEPSETAKSDASGATPEAAEAAVEPASDTEKPPEAPRAVPPAPDKNSEGGGGGGFTPGTFG